MSILGHHPDLCKRFSLCAPKLNKCLLLFFSWTKVQYMDINSTEKDLLTAGQVAERLGQTRRNVLRLTAKGKLKPALKLPTEKGAYLFSVETVEQYLKR